MAYAATGKTHAARAEPARFLDLASMPYKYVLPQGPLAPGEAESSKGAYAGDRAQSLSTRKPQDATVASCSSELPGNVSRLG